MDRAETLIADPFFIEDLGGVPGDARLQVPPTLWARALLDHPLSLSVGFGDFLKAGLMSAQEFAYNIWMEYL